MLIEIDGVDAHAEDDWIGSRVRIGEALVLMRGHVGIYGEAGRVAFGEPVAPA